MAERTTCPTFEPVYAGNTFSISVINFLVFDVQLNSIMFLQHPSEQIICTFMKMLKIRTCQGVSDI